MPDLHAINLHLQERLERDWREEVRAVEAARWLDSPGLLTRRFEALHLRVIGLIGHPSGTAKRDLCVLLTRFEFSGRLGPGFELHQLFRIAPKYRVRGTTCRLPAVGGTQPLVVMIVGAMRTFEGDRRVGRLEFGIRGVIDRVIEVAGRMVRVDDVYDEVGHDMADRAGPKCGLECLEDIVAAIQMHRHRDPFAILGEEFDGLIELAVVDMPVIFADQAFNFSFDLPFLLTVHRYAPSRCRLADDIVMTIDHARQGVHVRIELNRDSPYGTLPARRV